MGEATMKQRATKLSDHRVDLARELDKRGVVPRERWYGKTIVDWTRRDEEGKFVEKESRNDPR